MAGIVISSSVDLNLRAAVATASVPLALAAANPDSMRRPGGEWLLPAGVTLYHHRENFKRILDKGHSFCYDCLLKCRIGRVHGGKDPGWPGVGIVPLSWLFNPRIV